MVLVVLFPKKDEHFTKPVYEHLRENYTFRSLIGLWFELTG